MTKSSFVFAIGFLLLFGGNLPDAAFGQVSVEAEGQVDRPDDVVTPKESPNPATLTPEDDPRFELLGEFVGEITVDDVATRYGLQLRPLGELDFQGQLYEGGLPGEDGFDREEDGTRVIGLHSKEFVVISGGPAAIIAGPEFCLVMDREGNRVGKLERVWRVSPTLGAKAPADALVLFDGKGVDQFTNGKVTHDGLLKEGANVAPMVQDFNMHVEFLLPYEPDFDGQKRGNSGCYILSRYEVQVLDSFGLPPLNFGCGSIYRTRPPDINMSYPPLRWQTYDIVFTSPRWLSNGEKRRNAKITLWHNGVKIHDDIEISDKTGRGQPEEPSLLPILFQDHSHPVRYRNIWMIDRGLEVGADFPIYRGSDQEVSADPPLDLELPPPAAKVE